MKNLKNKYDVIIVGAGPAGLMAAKVLAENNREVLVIEKNKVIGPKVCGGGLTVKDFELGIPKKLVDRISNKVYIHTLLQNSVIESDKSFIATVDRKKLGQWMKKNLEKLGVKIINDTVDNIKKEKNQIILKSNNILSYNYLIGADGSNSIVRQRLDIPKKKLLLAYQYLVKKIYPRMELFVNVEKFGPWYIWIFPHKNFTSIGTGCDPNIFPAKKNRENFESWLDDQKVSLSDAKYEAWTINYDYRGFEFGNNV
ncbi:MAG: NAD(P)/FAD-dependent oxidoreductase [Patescibacteria group bacterium]|nr:NAD(P)/FAD-dependent oxidoreductase [Patescibacteria group bacterium]